jgi:glucose-6-phosphate 1-epimerase
MLSLVLAPSGYTTAHGLRSNSRITMMAAAAPATVDGALKTCTLSNAAGDSAVIYPFGACVTSYVKGGTDYLCVRPDAKLDGSKPISGGIPHCFPQFGPGAIQQHGFARNVDWEVAEQSDDKVVMRLTENDYTMEMWPHPFECTYTVKLGEESLNTEFSVTNTGDKPFDFTAALHTYWSVSGIKNIKITSPAFKGATYLDKMQSPPADVKSETDTITIKEEVDQVYAGVSGDVKLEDSKRKRPLTISNKLGWSDTVLWNPYGNEGMGFDSFVCVESAQAATPVVLQPGEYWTGAMDVVP